MWPLELILRDFIAPKDKRIYLPTLYCLFFFLVSFSLSLSVLSIITNDCVTFSVMWSRAVFVALGPCVYCVRLNVIFVEMVSVFRRGGSCGQALPIL